MELMSVCAREGKAGERRALCSHVPTHSSIACTNGRDNRVTRASDRVRHSLRMLFAMRDIPQENPVGPKHYLLVSDFDQTLSFNDSGNVLAEMLGIPDFESRVRGLSRLNLVQAGAELAYLMRHDPEFRRVRRADLLETGRRVRLKRNIAPLIQLLASG